MAKGFVGAIGEEARELPEVSQNVRLSHVRRGVAVVEAKNNDSQLWGALALRAPIRGNFAGHS
jgi:hypothetical protein